jgi:hypothetical protein
MNIMTAVANATTMVSCQTTFQGARMHRILL